MLCKCNIYINISVARSHNAIYVSILLLCNNNYINISAARSFLQRFIFFYTGMQDSDKLHKHLFSSSLLPLKALYIYLYMMLCNKHLDKHFCGSLSFHSQRFIFFCIMLCNIYINISVARYFHSQRNIFFNLMLCNI
jgi:hypothetical protein